jgi:hypothetical protein
MFLLVVGIGSLTDFEAGAGLAGALATGFVAALTTGAGLAAGFEAGADLAASLAVAGLDAATALAAGFATTFFAVITAFWAESVLATVFLATALGGASAGFLPAMAGAADSFAPSFAAGFLASDLVFTADCFFAVATS